MCDALDNTHVQYINDTLHIIRSVFKTPIYTLYQICKICVSFAVQYRYTFTLTFTSLVLKIILSVYLSQTRYRYSYGKV